MASGDASSSSSASCGLSTSCSSTRSRPRSTWSFGKTSSFGSRARLRPGAPPSSTRRISSTASTRGPPTYITSITRAALRGRAVSRRTSTTRSCVRWATPRPCSRWPSGGCGPRSPSRGPTKRTAAKRPPAGRARTRRVYRRAPALSPRGPRPSSTPAASRQAGCTLITPRTPKSMGRSETRIFPCFFLNWLFEVIKSKSLRATQRGSRHIRTRTPTPAVGCPR
mmetsp:Transcript_42776/g.96793  ORF Transcript_42776/g.96793 Transcript_42776/m.96793 type:complete len:224 (+) Transcript_42776:410-1081(+)